MTLTQRMKYVGIFLSLWLAGCTEVQFKPSEQFQHGQTGTLAASIAPAAQLSATATLSRGIEVWDLTQQHAKYLLHHDNKGQSLVHLLQFSPDGKFLLSADQQSIALWRMADGKNLGFWSIPNGLIRDIALSADAKHLVVGQHDGKVLHINLNSGRRLEFLGHSESINSVAVSANGRYVLSGSSDLHAHLWDSQSGQIVRSFVHPTRVTKVALDAQGRFAFTADSQQQATIWQLPSGTVAQQLDLDRGRIFTSARFSDDGTLLITGGASRQVTLWRTSDGKIQQQFLVSPTKADRTGGGVVYDAVFIAPNRILTESSAGLAEYWDIKP